MISKKILQLFPPPKFLDIPYAGLSISNAHVRMIQFETANSGNLKVKKYAELPLPSGAVTSGQINNKDQIVAVLKELKKNTNIEYVRVAIPEEKAYLFEIEIPIVSPKEIRSAIEFKIEENVPLPANQVIFDYAVLLHKSGNDHLKVNISALPAKFVTIYMDLFDSAELMPLVFEIESRAMAKALLSPDDLGTYIIVHFSSDKFGLCVVSRGIVHFTSTLATTEGWRDDPSSMISEIRKVVAYWQTKRPEGEENNDVITKIFMSGDKLSDAMASQLSSNLGIETVLGNVWLNAFDVNTIVPEIPFSRSLQYTSAVGLALPSDSLI